MSAEPVQVRRVRRWSVPVVLAVCAAVLAVIAAPGPASAEPLTITDASFRWRVNPELQGSSPFGDCNYLSAGRSDGTEATYRAAEGDVHIEKMGGAPTWASKCAFDGNRSTDQELVWTGGTGVVDPETGEVLLSFEGAASIVFYGGLLPFTIVDPVIRVAADGTGEMVATMEGFASSMDDPHTKDPLVPVPGVVVATLGGVESANDTGFTAKPTYEGVVYNADPKVAAPQIRSIPGWGSWPTSFVDFHMVTGLSSYWYTSGGAFDPKKPPYAFQVTYEGIGEPTTPSTTTTTSRPVTSTTTSPTTTTPTGTTPVRPPTPRPSAPSSPAGSSGGAPAGSRTTTVYRTIGGGTSGGSSTNGSGNGSPGSPGGSGTGSPTTTRTATGALAWTVPADGVVRSDGGELGPIAIADTRAGGRGWTLTGRLQGAAAGWTPKLLRDGAGAELGFVVDALRDPAILARARTGNPPGWATVAADLELVAGKGPVTVTVTAIS